MTNVNIVVDDLRAAPKNWLLFKNPEEFMIWRRRNPSIIINILSLDHDMGDNYYTGYDLVRFLTDCDNLNIASIHRIQFHTDNMDGMRNMYNHLIDAQTKNTIDSNIKIIREKLDLIDGNLRFSGYSFRR